MKSLLKPSWPLLVCTVLLMARCEAGLRSLPPSFQAASAPKQSGASAPDRPVSAPAKSGVETTVFLQATSVMRTNAGPTTPHPRPLQALPKDVTAFRSLPKDVTASHSLSKDVAASHSLHTTTEPETHAAAGADSLLPTQHDVVTTSDPLRMEREPDTNTATSSDIPPPPEKDTAFVAGFLQTSTMHQTPVIVASDSFPLTPEHKPTESTLNYSLCPLGIRDFNELRSFLAGAIDMSDCEESHLTRRRPFGSSCYYEGAEAACLGEEEHLCYLPKLPAHIRNFFLVGPLALTLSRPGLANLSSSADLRVLRLHCNWIYHLEPRTFTDFPRLEALDLSHNLIEMTHLKTGLESINSSGLKRLDLNFMGLTTLPDYFFDMFTSRSLDTLSLRGNGLRSFNSAVFAPFLQVRTLDLSNNIISSVLITTRLNIQNLVLTGNSFSRDLPDLCLRHLPNNVMNAFSNLKALHIGRNDLLTPSRLRGECFPHLVKLDISSSSTRRLPNNFIAELLRLQHLLANNMTKLERYQPTCFKSLSLKTLSLQQNMKITKRNLYYRFQFQANPNLEEVTIAGTILELSEKQLRDLLVPLKSLTSLTLESVGLVFVPSDLLWRLPKLQKLNLAWNGISGATLHLALKNVTSLHHLEIQHNNIVMLNESILPWPLRRHLTYLDVSANPFLCTCELLWFKRWIEDAGGSGSLTVHNYPSKDHYVCGLPPSKKGVPLRDFQPTDKECGGRSTGVVLIAVGVCPLVLLSVLLGVAYRYRWYIRFYLYRCRRLQTGEPADGPEAFEYDVYVAYSSDDLRWVRDHLLPLLEEEHGLTTFLHDRDSLPGSVVADNIPRFMDQCARVVVLLSQTYLRQQWRLYEFQHVVFAAVDQEKDVVVVLLGDVDAGHMTRDMRRMLTRGTFLQWGPSEEAQRAFRQGLTVALTTRDPTCETLC